MSQSDKMVADVLRLPSDYGCPCHQSLLHINSVGSKTLRQCKLLFPTEIINYQLSIINFSYSLFFKLKLSSIPFVMYAFLSAVRIMKSISPHLFLINSDAF